MGDIALLKKENSNLLAQLNSAKKRERNHENERFIDELLKTNKLVPGGRENALALLNLAADVDHGDLALLSAGGGGKKA